MTPPEPMTPPDCDLRGYEFMPLLGQRLYGSEFYSLALRNPRAGLAAQKLWWEAWQQCPAGSLPGDEFTLCRLADFGTDMKAWDRAKTIALHGFVLCSDGRYYHPLLCQQAIHAYEKRTKGRERKARWRASRDGDGTPGPEDVPRDTTETETETEPSRNVLTGQDGTGQVKKEREEGRSLRSLGQKPSENGFEEWWQRYPRKRAKAPARRAYAKAIKGGADPAELLQALATQRWSPDKQFIPHAATWLNEERWQDEPEAAAPPPVPVHRESSDERRRRELGILPVFTLKHYEQLEQANKRGVDYDA